MRTAVILMSHGSPDSLDQMEPYLKHIMTRRPPTPEFVEEMKERYRLIGGKSPLLEITQAQASALSKRLGRPVYVGMRHWTPFIHEAVEVARRAGAERLIGLALAPQYSDVSVGAYQKVLKAAALDLRVDMVMSWARDPNLHAYWASRLCAGPAILFTAHSIPVEGAGLYPAEIEETILGIARLVPDLRWTFAYQSRSPSPVEWLGPDVPAKLQELVGEDVHVAPIGFVADHVEILYDLDILHRKQAEELGIRWTRVTMPNAHPLLIEALAKAVESIL